MSISVEDENKIVRWAFAEIIGYLKQNHDAYWFKYNPSKLRMHKALFRFFETANIPVTRSWFRYGCFIHSNQLAAQEFGILKGRYLASQGSPERLRSHVARLNIDVEGAVPQIEQALDSLPRRMDEYMPTLYEGAPEGLGNLYLSKLGLQNSLKRPGDLTFSQQKYQNWLLNIRRKFSSFHMAAFSDSRFTNLIDITWNFTDNVEEALLKIEESFVERNRFIYRSFGLIDALYKFFDQYVWLPFALKISAMTVKGYREVEERSKLQGNLNLSVAKSSVALADLSGKLRDRGFMMDWNECINEINRSAINRDVSKAICRMERLYEKYSDRE